MQYRRRMKTKNSTILWAAVTQRRCMNLYLSGILVHPEHAEQAAPVSTLNELAFRPLCDPV